MYQVFCRSPKKFSHWVPYSSIHKTKKGADTVRQWAVNQRGCDFDGNLLLYEVREVEAPEEMDEELELRADQIARIDEVENAVFEMCRVLTEKEILDWDISFIGEIADLAAEILAKHGYRVRYPAIVDDDEGDGQHFEDFFEPKDYQKD